MQRTVFIPALASGVLAAVLMVPATRPVGAEDPTPGQEFAGQADLDEATLVKLSAKRLGDWGKVITLCESALEKGLDEGNAFFAKELLTSTLYQRALQICQPIFDGAKPDRKWPQLRQFALKDLENIIRHDDQMGDVHLLMARLLVLPGGDRQRAAKAVRQAVPLLQSDPVGLSKALVLKAGLHKNAQQQLVDLSEAVKQDPNNLDALKMRGVVHLALGDHQSAIADFKTIVANDPGDLTAHQGFAEALDSAEKYDEALEQADKIIELVPKLPVGYILRARFHHRKGDVKATLADLGEAIKIEPRSLRALMMRAQIYHERGDVQPARADVERALTLRPGYQPAILLRSSLAAAAGQLEQAIADIDTLLQGNGNNPLLLVQLAALHAADRRPRKAIEIYNQVVTKHAANWAALRGRADARLSIGQHADAIDDFEAAMKLQAHDDGILNNFAWVLATSPNERLRDGRRAIELAKTACELTEYKKPHILSTLAAGYAETGDFQTAIRWSEKAVQLGQPPVKEQLAKELQSYKANKPWREKQLIQEKGDAQPPEDDEADLN